MKSTLYLLVFVLVAITLFLLYQLNNCKQTCSNLKEFFVTQAPTGVPTATNQVITGKPVVIKPGQQIPNRAQLEKMAENAVRQAQHRGQLQHPQNNNQATSQDNQNSYGQNGKPMKLSKQERKDIKKHVKSRLSCLLNLCDHYNALPPQDKVDLNHELGGDSVYPQKLQQLQKKYHPPPPGVPIPTYKPITPHPEDMEIRYNCENNQCTEGGPHGRFATLSECNAHCPKPTRPPITYDCKNNKCRENNNGNGQYKTLDECHQHCKPSYACNNGKCIESEDGQYNSLEECNSSCTTKYSCDQSTGNCYQDKNGKYFSIEQCQSNCVPTTQPPAPPEETPSPAPPAPEETPSPAPPAPEETPSPAPPSPASEETPSPEAPHSPEEEESYVHGGCCSAPGDFWTCRNSKGIQQSGYDGYGSLCKSSGGPGYGSGAQQHCEDRCSRGQQGQQPTDCNPGNCMCMNIHTGKEAESCKGTIFSNECVANWKCTKASCGGVNEAGHSWCQSNAVDSDGGPDREAHATAAGCVKDTPSSCKTAGDWDKYNVKLCPGDPKLWHDYIRTNRAQAALGGHGSGYHPGDKCWVHQAGHEKADTPNQ